MDFLSLCEHNVRTIEADLANNGKLLNRRQCLDLATKLSRTSLNIGELVLRCGIPAGLFRPALESLYRSLEKAKLLVHKCGRKPWWEAAAFQIHNENSFQEILLEVSLCYNAIYELAKSTSEDWSDPPEDLRLSLVFQPATDSDVGEDKQDLRKRLEALANKRSFSVKLRDILLPGRRAVKQSLAKYLLVKMDCASEQSQAITLGECSAILWAKESEPEETWGNSRFLGSGSGSSGVCKTKWLGIPCAKKEFHDIETESFFLKEAGILAHLKHPCVVNLFCCGNGQERGDRFIAMELLEKSLSHLIEDQKGMHFSLPVVVDMMAQIARGMCYLHDQGVAHRDLKPLNVVVNRLTCPHLGDYFCVKLVDFGVSKVKVQGNKSNTISFRGVGTTKYRAPEVHPKAHANGKRKAFWFKADVFSFAITCVHLLSLLPPLGDIEQLKLPNDCPKDLALLLRDCWNTNPLNRPSFIEVCIRLETFRYKLLRGFSTLDEDLREENVGFNSGPHFIRKKLEEQSSIQSPLVDNIDVGEASEAETLNSQENKKNDMVEEGDEEGYHSETCQFDVHPGCAHALSTKYPKKMLHPGRPHLLTLLQSPSGKRLSGTCKGSSKGYLCTCTLKWRAFESWGRRPATMELGNFIPAPISPALRRSWVLTSSFQPRRKARLGLSFPRLPPPASSLRLILSPWLHLASKTPQYFFTPRQLRPRFSAFYT